MTLCCPPAGAPHRGVLTSPKTPGAGSVRCCERQVLLFSVVLVEGEIQPRTTLVSVNPVWTWGLNNSSFHLWSLYYHSVIHSTNTESVLRPRRRGQVPGQGRAGNRRVRR